MPVLDEGETDLSKNPRKSLFHQPWPQNLTDYRAWHPSLAFNGTHYLFQWTPRANWNDQRKYQPTTWQQMVSVAWHVVWYIRERFLDMYRKNYQILNGERSIALPNKDLPVTYCISSNFPPSLSKQLNLVFRPLPQYSLATYPKDSPLLPRFTFFLRLSQNSTWQLQLICFNTLFLKLDPLIREK